VEVECAACAGKGVRLGKVVDLSGTGAGTMERCSCVMGRTGRRGGRGGRGGGRAGGRGKRGNTRGRR
jgi:hypothetical protein